MTEAVARGRDYSKDVTVSRAYRVFVVACFRFELVACARRYRGWIANDRLHVGTTLQANLCIEARALGHAHTKLGAVRRARIHLLEFRAGELVGRALFFTIRILQRSGTFVDAVRPHLDATRR